MTRRTSGPLLRLLACALLYTGSLSLAGCVHATRSTIIHHYDLGSVVAAAGNHHEVDRTGKVLQVDSIATPAWLAGTAMHYRLLYRDNRRVAAYAQSDWISPPATLLEPVLRSAIAAGSGWRAVLGPRDPAQADTRLHIRLDDFSQVFSEPGDSAGVVDATATLIDNHDDHVIAQRHFHVEIAAPSPNAAGGVAALAKASRELATQLQDWLR
ncbi:MAG: membrane integrity-associated transporter subunit PqiC [Proteobacteria bacterium]|nr:membrane integrity-associated transporter subunit PqiC [Pseudomonadota bacterium]